MHVFLTRELKSWIANCVSTGAYASEGHLVRRALRLLKEHESDVNEGRTESVPAVQTRTVPQALELVRARS